jgi:hypothetical protein
LDSSGKLPRKPSAYAAYRLAKPRSRSSDLDEDALGKVVAAIRPDVVSKQDATVWIWDVVQRLEPKLEEASLANPRYR